MAWNGTGTYVLPPAYSPEINGTVIDATRYNGLTTDVATGITNALAKDGQNVPTANMPWGGFKITGLGAPSTPGDALSWGAAGNLTSLVLAGALSGVTDLTTTGNTILGNAIGDTLNVGGGSFTVNASGESLFLTASSTKSIIVQDTGAAGANIKFIGNGVTTPNKYIRTTGGSFQIISSDYTRNLFDLSDTGFLGLGGTAARNSATIDVNGGLVVGLGNLGGNSDSAAWSVYGGLTALNGAYISLYGGSHATNANQMVFGNASATRMLLNALGYLNIGTASATYQAQVSGAGQVVAAMTDAGNKGSALYLLDTASAGAGNGGAVLFGAFNIATPFAGIKGFITNASGQSQGDIVFLNRNSSVDVALTERLRIGTTGNLYGTALHNNSAGAGTASSTQQHIASGTYTPTFSSTTNVASNTVQAFQWTRVGNVVTVSGQTTLAETANNTNTQSSFTLPLDPVSNFAASETLSGVIVRGGASTVPHQAGVIYGTAGAKTATFQFNGGSNTGAVLTTYHFSYLIG